MAESRRARSVIEVLLVFFRLGLTSFGGPVAHLGYFRREFVQRRRWMDEACYADLVALCQFLPGPASSQFGMVVGFMRAGWLGACAAWVGFTLPSAIALILFAYGVTHWSGLVSSGVVHGLELAAVAVVTQAVCGMAKSLCLDWYRVTIAVVSALTTLVLPTAVGQMGAIFLGGLLGLLTQRLSSVSPAAQSYYRLSRCTGGLLLGLFFFLLAILPLLAAGKFSTWLNPIAVFYKAGALVFGGGHVVLPLLQTGVVSSGWVSNETFLAGYGAAQTMPGPLFAFAAFAGAVMPAPWGGWIGGITLLLVIFLPAALSVFGILPFWESVRQREGMQRALNGINAAVVGLLAAALYKPIGTSALHAYADFSVALAAFVLLVYTRISPMIVVPLTALAGWGVATLSTSSSWV